MSSSADWDQLWRNGGFNRWPDDNLVRWAATLEPSLVLEVGCGAGPNLRALESFGHEACGVDISTEAVRASESLPGPSRATVITPVSAIDLPFGDEEFDAVCDVQCFQHLTQEDLPLAYAEAARVLKPRGRFFEVFLTQGQENFPGLSFAEWRPVVAARSFSNGGRQGQLKRWSLDGHFYEYLLLECVK